MKTQDKDGKPFFMADHIMGKKNLDFPDLFATDPKVVEKGIGLQPAAFQDFHFANTNTAGNAGDQKENK
jgi:hypothetical protein